VTPADPTPEADLRSAIEKLQVQISGLEKKLESVPKKDKWDKLSSVSSLITGGAVVLIGIVATAAYTIRQQNLQDAQADASYKLQSVQMVDKFFARFTDPDPRIHSASLQVIMAIDPKLAVKIAESFQIGDRPADSTVARTAQQVLANLATSSDKNVGKLASDALVRSQSDLRAQAIVNIFETGKSEPGYGDVLVLAGDPGHLTYGAPQASLASGNLYQLVKAYVESPGATYAAQLRPFLDRLSAKDFSLDSDTTFRKLLVEAANDVVMQRVQDKFVTDRYWLPAVARAQELGIQTPLGKAVIYDSTVQGGEATVRGETTAQLGGTPLTGVDEHRWITAYLANRRKFLSQRGSPLERTVYRPDTFIYLAKAANWDLIPPLTISGITLAK